MNKDDLEKHLDRTHEWIRAADQKISIWLAFQGVFITLIVPTIFSKSLVKILFFCPCWTMFLIIAFASIGYSIFNAVWALIPRLKNHPGKKSFLYFGDIASISFDEYKNQLGTRTAADFEEDVKNQIYICSKISYRKHCLFRKSIIYFFIGTGSFLLLLFSIIL